jgi:hypothetical protein
VTRRPSGATTRARAPFPPHLLVPLFVLAPFLGLGVVALLAQVVEPALLAVGVRVVFALVLVGGPTIAWWRWRRRSG